MKRMTVINPNMATLGQERLGLSPFGLLSRLFTLELNGRVHREEGLWQQLALELLEDGESEDSREQPPAPEIHLNLDLKILMKALREERARYSEPKQPQNQSSRKEPEKKKKSKKQEQAEKIEAEKKPVSLTTEQRILERILLRERESRETTVVRLLKQGNFAQGNIPVGSNTAAILRGEQIVLFRQKHQSPASNKSDTIISDAFAEVHPVVSVAPGNRVPQDVVSSGPAAGIRGSNPHTHDISFLSSLLRKENAGYSPVLRLQESTYGSHEHGILPQTYGTAADLIFQESPSDDRRTEEADSVQRRSVTGERSSLRPATPSQQSVTPPSDAAIWRKTPALNTQPGTASHSISTLAQLNKQKDAQLSSAEAMPNNAPKRAVASVDMPLSQPNLPLVTQATTIPSGEGWTPQWQAEHPGVPAKTADRAESPGGSILLPDLLRYRREQAVSGASSSDEDRLPAALSAALKRAVDREHVTRSSSANQFKNQYASDKATNTEIARSNSQNLTSQAQMMPAVHSLPSAELKYRTAEPSEDQNSLQTKSTVQSLSEKKNVAVQKPLPENAAREAPFVQTAQPPFQPSNIPVDATLNQAVQHPLQPTNIAANAERAIPAGISVESALPVSSAEMEYRAQELVKQQNTQPSITAVLPLADQNIATLQQSFLCIHQQKPRKRKLLNQRTQRQASLRIQ